MLYDLEQHIKNWNYWRKHCDCSWIHKIMVLFKVIHSPSFESIKALDMVGDLVQQVAYNMNKLSDVIKDWSITITANGIKEEKDE